VVVESPVAASGGAVGLVPTLFIPRSASLGNGQDGRTSDSPSNSARMSARKSARRSLQGMIPVCALMYTLLPLHRQLPPFFYTAIGTVLLFFCLHCVLP
jgi:hypothetical protein